MRANFRLLAAFGFFIALLSSWFAISEEREDRWIPIEDLKSGIEFQQPDTQALQEDAFANPGLLWLENGQALFITQTGKAQKACSDCHGANGDELIGTAAKYPSYNIKNKQLMNLEQRINNCRVKHQKDEELAYESDDLLALTAYVANLSKGKPFSVSIEGPAKPYFDQGKEYYFTRRGQLNLSCNQCHDQNWGKMLRGDRLSQGHGTGYPSYRFTWERMGSLQRRLRDCDAGVRAEPFGYGAPEYVALELYLAWRAANLPLEAPAVRR